MVSLTKRAGCLLRFRFNKIDACIMRTILLLFITSACLFGQAAALPVPLPRWQPLDDNGHTVPFGKLCTYSTGTFTPRATYTDSEGMSQLPNPIILDAAGRANPFFSAGAYYRISFQQPGDNNCPGTGAVIWTQDSFPPSSTANLSQQYSIPRVSGTPGVLEPSGLDCGPSLCQIPAPGVTFTVGTTISLGLNPAGGTDEVSIANTSGNAHLFMYTTAGTSGSLGVFGTGGLPLILAPSGGDVQIAGPSLTLNLGTVPHCTHGTNATCGVVGLVAGAATVTTSAIRAQATAGAPGDAVRLTYQTCSSCGTLHVGFVNSGAGFIINSNNGGDISDVFWEIQRIN